MTASSSEHTTREKLLAHRANAGKCIHTTLFAVSRLQDSRVMRVFKSILSLRNSNRHNSDAKNVRQPGFVLIQFSGVQSTAQCTLYTRFDFAVDTRMCSIQLHIQIHYTTVESIDERPNTCKKLFSLYFVCVWVCVSRCMQHLRQATRQIKKMNKTQQSRKRDTDTRACTREVLLKAHQSVRTQKV